MIVYSDIRVVEVRIVRSELFASRFEKTAELSLGGGRSSKGAGRAAFGGVRERE